MNQYKIITHPESLQKAAAYQKALTTDGAAGGTYLKRNLKDQPIAQLETADFIERLVRTKQPQIFAESAVYGDGSDWTSAELSILGDISISVPVSVFDNGRHSSPEVHTHPFDGTLLYVPGALLRNGRGGTPADWDEVTTDGQIDADAYDALYERRLLPVFLYADRLAKTQDRMALITIPGLGCGQFAGPFRGQLGEKLRAALLRFLEHQGKCFSNIQAVYFDPYQECQNERHEIGGISFLVRPLTQGNAGRPQLCRPQAYADSSDDFSACALFSIVAWDHVSWPGNDFYLGSRATDDGVKAAATDTMAVMTGVEGAYNLRTNTYDPPHGYRNWNDVVQEHQLQIQVKDSLIVLPAPGT